MNCRHSGENIIGYGIKMQKSLMGKQANWCCLKGVIEDPEASICSRKQPASFLHHSEEISMHKPLEENCSLREVRFYRGGLAPSPHLDNIPRGQASREVQSLLIGRLSWYHWFRVSESREKRRQGEKLYMPPAAGSVQSSLKLFGDSRLIHWIHSLHRREMLSTTQSFRFTGDRFLNLYNL